jgi:hypothetical protein
MALTVGARVAVVMTRVVKVHVGVSRELQVKLEAGSISITDFTHAIGLSKVDTGKLKDFGILTGEAEAERLDDIRKRTGIDFIEEDRSRRVM